MWRFMQRSHCWMRTWEVCAIPEFASGVQTGSTEARLSPYLLGVLESTVWKFPHRADSTSKFKKEKWLASPSSEHEMSAVTWGRDEISLTGRSKQLICSQSKHSTSGFSKTRSWNPLIFCIFPSPHVLSLKEQRKLRSQGFFSILD